MSHLVLLRELWRRERRAADERFAAARRALPLAERVARGLAARDLDIDDLGPAPGGRTRLDLVARVPAELEDLRLGAGDPVRLWWETPDQPDAVRAVVARRNGRALAVIADGELPERLEHGEFHLDADAPATTFDRGDRALARALEAPAQSDLGRLRDVLLGVHAPVFAPAPAWTPLDQELNAPQRAAVALALSAAELALVHGPPGTGKTRTLVEIVRQLLERGERVLCTAASNAAVDNLGERLAAAGVPFVRLGHPARVAPAVEAHTLDARLAAHDTAQLARGWLAEARELRRRALARRERGARDEARELFAEARRLDADARQQLRLAEDAILAGAPVVCATAAGADAASLGDTRFDTVVVDEATQAPDPIALVALARAARAVLAGDPCQLPPTVVDPEAARAGLASTFFERVAAGAAGEAALRLLTVQHRMHATIMAFPSERMYGGRLEAAPAVAAHTLEELGVAPDPARPGPLVFIDTVGTGWSEERAEDDPSTHNAGHAERTAEEARRLLARGLAPADLAVITPYDAQVRLLRGLLAAERAAGLEIGTVDGFQGREKEAIIVDTVRSNERHELGFLADVRRMNVALTRARRFLLVLGDSATLGAHSFYKSFMDHAEQTGGYLSAWA
jgi:superfamily I DNA and/or RNA helicase